MTTSKILSNALANSSPSVREKRNIKEFVAEYSEKELADIDWGCLCADAKRHKCCKFAFRVLYELLCNHLYSGNFSEFLYKNMGLYTEFCSCDTDYEQVMCGEKIPNQIIIPEQEPRRSKKNAAKYRYYYLRTQNAFIKEIMMSFLVVRQENRWSISPVIEVFEESFGEYRNHIYKIEDFNSKTFFVQVAYYRNYFADEPLLFAYALRTIVTFYRWLVRTYPEHAFFADAFDMSKSLLFNAGLVQLIAQDYYFATLDPTNIPYGKHRVCFLLRNLDNHSTRINKEDYVALDLSTLKSQYYRDLLLEFISTSTSIASIKWVGHTHYIRDGMQALYEAKQSVGYPNPLVNHLTSQEAVFLKQYFGGEDISLATKNNKIGALRRFLNYCVNKGAISVDEVFFDYLVQYEEPAKTSGKAVSDDVLVALHQALLERSEKDLFYKEVFVIFHLLLQTEFRINQICHLTIDSVKPTIKPNQFSVRSNTKTSHGRKEDFVISTTTYNLLMDIIEETEDARASCCIDGLKEYIFVYPTKAGLAKMALFNNQVFSRALKKVCKEMGIESCNAAMLRDTHMTKALEHILRNGKSDLDMSVLSKHKHLDTTTSHYIELELEKMLEATYGIVIGKEDIQADSKVVDTVPMHLEGPENDVEDGCGKCTADVCVMTNTLPCMVCKHFITTVKHKQFFENAIESINRLIEHTTNRHEKEDLVTIKTLYVLYLKAIIKHKEGDLVGC